MEQMRMDIFDSSESSKSNIIFFLARATFIFYTPAMRTKAFMSRQVSSKRKCSSVI